jgi:autophagy-related protein 9
VAFIAGSFAAVLLVASLIDPDLFLHFEITKHRTVLFYLGVFGTVLAVARGMIPEDKLVFDPEQSLREVVHYTHYLPGEWKGKLHSQMVSCDVKRLLADGYQVHQQFGQLFEMKITVFLTELASVLLTPLILWFSLPPCAAAIVDFFREFTVHVEGVGYVCSFAVFDFKRHGNVKVGELHSRRRYMLMMSVWRTRQ